MHALFLAKDALLYHAISSIVFLSYAALFFPRGERRRRLLSLIFSCAAAILACAGAIVLVVSVTPSGPPGPTPLTLTQQLAIDVATRSLLALILIVSLWASTPPQVPAAIAIAALTAGSISYGVLPIGQSGPNAHLFRPLRHALSYGVYNLCIWHGTVLGLAGAWVLRRGREPREPDVAS